jgi:ABC-2 type transport system ATP-binding protein
MLEEIHRAGTTIMLTTHHLDEAQEQCDRIVIVDHGQVIADGSLAELIERTTGRERRVQLSVEGDFQARIAGLQFDEAAQCWTAALEDIGSELPGLLDAVRACGGQVTRLEVYEPTLHEVFLHLTGRELRE